MTAEDILEVRSDPKLWFNGFSRVKHLVTQQPIIPRAKPLQRRGFAHYKRCQDAGMPCRQIWVKGRRAGGSDGCAALIYVHAQNHIARCGQMGTNYRTSHNMLDKVKFFGQHDDFPGWTAPKVAGKVKIPADQYYTADELPTLSFAQRADKILDAKITWPHGSSVELYTAENPESARSAGLQSFHWTEFFRAPVGGILDAGETLNAMIKTVPKRGFTFIGLEGTANGAQGAGYDLVRSARWPEEDTWWTKWEAMWPQNVAKIGKELQFVIIFSAWFEDLENQLECSPDERRHLEETMDAEERKLIERYQCEGPKGPRLGDEVDTTVWNQLKWRRATIEHECKQGGIDEFKQEFPSDILEAFRSSGSPALDQDGLMAMEIDARNCPPELPRHGQITHHEKTNTFSWETVDKDQAIFLQWEPPIAGCKYVVSCDPMSGAELVTGTGEKDRHAIFVLRDAYIDTLTKQYKREKIVARVKPPCQFESIPAARLIWLLSKLYGDATIVVESNMGAAILNELNDSSYNANLYQREELSKVTQKVTKLLGWWTTESSKRILIGALQSAVREQTLECHDMHAISEMRNLIVDSKGHAKGSGSRHDDDPIGISLALAILPHAHIYFPSSVQGIRETVADERRWKIVN